jgi:flagellar basal body-associated protein FliL
MSDEPVKPAAAAPSAGAKTSKVVLILLVLNLGASGFGTFKAVTAKPAHAAAPAEKKHETNEKIEVTGPVVPLDPFVVNLDEPGQSRYLKVTFQLELVKPDAQALIEKNKQVIRDSILSHLSGLKLADTLGVAAKDKMRSELMKKLEEIVGEHKVRRMFIQEFVVQ